MPLENNRKSYASLSNELAYLQNKSRSSLNKEPVYCHNYRIEKVIGSGSFSIVFLGIHKDTNQQVAIKHMYLSERQIELTVSVLKNRKIRISSVYPKKVLEEIQFLRECKHQGIISLIEVLHEGILTGNTSELDTCGCTNSSSVISLVFPYIGSTLKLNLLIRRHLETKDILSYTIQLINALKYLHEKSIIHCDIKPDNIVIDLRNNLTIIDLGIARRVDDYGNLPRIARWYSAPEVILGTKEYTTAIDIWAAGCVIIEMIEGKPLFKGSSINQMSTITDICGEIRLNEFLMSNQSTNEESIIAKGKQNTLPKRTKDYHLPISDLLTKMIDINPMTRITAAEAYKYLEDNLDRINKNIYEDTSKMK
ncbi:p38 MAP kinase [Nematocida sp. AWRm80]|nr:p38 MAP kinase [Nematocida sp. AWRm80]